MRCAVINCVLYILLDYKHELIKNIITDNKRVNVTVKDLGQATGTQRQTSIILLKMHDDYTELYDSLWNEVKSLPLPI